MIDRGLATITSTGSCFVSVTSEGMLTTVLESAISSFQLRGLLFLDDERNKITELRIEG